MRRHALTFTVRLCNRLRKESDASHRCIVCGDWVLDEREVAVTAGETYYGDTELVCFTHRSVLVPGVYDKHSGRQVLHGHESTESSKQLFDLAIDQQALALRVLLELACLALLHEALKTLDALVDVLEVGECATDPSTCDVRCIDALCEVFNDADSLVFATYEKYLFAGRCNSGHKSFCCLKAFLGKLKIKDVCAVFSTKEERGSCRVATCSGVAEVCSGLKENIDVAGLHMYTIVAGISGVW